MICVYPADCTDFSTNGNGTIEPTSALVTETLNGEYELQLVHPIDEAGKWQRLVEGCILRAPVPAATTPRVHFTAPGDDSGTEIYRIHTDFPGAETRKGTLNLRSGPGSNYKIEQDHEAIIDPDAFRRVQDEILRRKNKPCRGMTIFSGRIFCAECGACFGPKVWHSNDQYRRVIWQCNNKYKGTKVCQMPHLYEDGLQAEFLRLCNKVVSNREREIADLRELLAVIGGTEELETKKARLEAERDTLAERLQALIDQNSKVALNQEIYILQYDELADQYTAADEKVKEMEQAILEREIRIRQINDFITALETMPSTVTEFRPELWGSLVDRVTVYGKNKLKFTLNSGMEISV